MRSRYCQGLLSLSIARVGPNKIRTTRPAARILSAPCPSSRVRTMECGRGHGRSAVGDEAPLRVRGSFCVRPLFPVRTESSCEGEERALRRPFKMRGEGLSSSWRRRGCSLSWLRGLFRQRGGGSIRQVSRGLPDNRKKRRSKGTSLFVPCSPILWGATLPDPNTRSCTPWARAEPHRQLSGGVLGLIRRRGLLARVLSFQRQRFGIVKWLPPIVSLTTGTYLYWPALIAAQ